MSFCPHLPLPYLYAAPPASCSTGLMFSYVGEEHRSHRQSHQCHKGTQHNCAGPSGGAVICGEVSAPTGLSVILLLRYTLNWRPGAGQQLLWERRHQPAETRSPAYGSSPEDR